MNFEFNPSNNIIKLCMAGMVERDNGKSEDADVLFHKAWDASTNDYERFIASYFVAHSQNDTIEKLKWLELSLQHALMVNDENVKSAFKRLYLDIAMCYDSLKNTEKANTNYNLSYSHTGIPSDKGPFFHGTKAILNIGDQLTAGGISNYKSELIMNHVYFTANLNIARLAATLAKGTEQERIYIVEPTGTFENDPNVTDKKFPGNLTRSYRSQEPLKIIGEVTDWDKQVTEEKKEWLDKLKNNKGEIIN